MAEHGSDTFHHVRDSASFEVPRFLVDWFGEAAFTLPKLQLFGLEFQLTKFMVLQVIAGLLTLLIFTDLARRIRGGKPATGAWANFWEFLALFIRDYVVRPTIGAGHHEEHAHDDHGHAEHGHAEHGHAEHGHGHAAVPTGAHPADRYLPFIWTCFFYILFCNLLGAIPSLGSPTGNLNVTGTLAVSALVCTFVAGVREFGVAGFFKNLVPPINAPGLIRPLLVGLMFLIEAAGLLIKHCALAIRLFANIMGGHTVIGVMLGFIAAMSHSGLWYLVTPASILGQIGIGLLELFVAFLQAYVFSFLATIFISMASHAH
jgi:F-type H+-transporting ATPase subunit a